MFVLIAGGGRTATQLAVTLISSGHDVRLIEHRAPILARMHLEVPTETIYLGYATDPHTLEQAGVRKAHVIAACTESDADNLAICFAARTLYDVPRTIARIGNPRAAWLFGPHFHVDAALNQAEAMASLILEEMSLGDMMPLLKLRRGQFSLVEEKIPPGAKAAGIMIKDLALPENCVIAAIIRSGKLLVPRGITTFEAGDEVLAVADHEGAEELARLFAPPTYPVRG
jgi:trk system potassium uptake protein TrkA